MNTSVETGNKNNKGRKWLFFAIGIIIGVVVCGTFDIISRLLFDKTPSITQTIKHIYQQKEPARENETKTSISAKNKTVASDPASTLDSLYQDTLELQDDPALDLEEVEFSINEDENNEMVAVDNMIAKKSIKVQYKDNNLKDILPVNNDIVYFEIQQWNSPIRNRITYHRKNNVLNIKGMDISNVSIIHYNDHYYLLSGTHLYIINNNDNYEKLVEDNAVTL